MAFSSSFLSEEQLLCSICLDVFTDPVTTPCGHNFCKKCLAEYWDSSDHCQCPLCNKSFETRPDLSINTLISETAAQFKQSVKVNTANATEENACTSTKVSCDACTGVKQISVRSCLNCGASYCEIHLAPHKNIQNLKKHKLINPVENLEDYICQKHERPLELFCRDDQTCVCQFCTEGDHKNHNTVPVEEANAELKACLKKTQTEVQQMIQERLEKTEEIKHSLELSKKSTEEEISQGVEVFTALIRSIERSQAELLEVMEEKQNAAERQAEGLIKELEQEITVLKRKDLHLDQLSNAENYLQKIQIYSSMCSPPHTKNWTEISINTDLSRETLRTSLSHLHKELNNEMDKEMQKLKQMSQQKAEAFSMNQTQLLLLLLLSAAFLVPVSNAIWIQIYAVDVTLDLDTASKYLIVSQDGKEVRSEDTWINVPYNPKRFVHDPYVLAKEGFSSGRFYYEVQVRGKTEWDLGVARESISRYGKIYPNYKGGTWSMIQRHGSDYSACAGSCVRLTLREKVEKVGVFVDYEEGLVSFYDAEARSHIYSITGQSFTEKLYPFFSPGLTYDNGNSAPLIIYDGYKYLITLRQFFSTTIQQWF
ncbi:E3 ubiquitin-protein ligase TRIM39 [Pangasianodon hypophthalmus]|uniref:E3 ubiquitin-protein ligase TRIM39 n=1 Tax=Pangasianodon hypophthalmus TaxID=310915 RepID=UPI00230774C3|nr:E3 ubiquitin-protein ligase TRIM39 [Pangasianodon hypophthalmus]